MCFRTLHVCLYSVHFLKNKRGTMSWLEQYTNIPHKGERSLLLCLSLTWMMFESDLDDVWVQLAPLANHWAKSHQNNVISFFLLHAGYLCSVHLMSYIYSSHKIFFIIYIKILSCRVKVQLFLGCRWAGNLISSY